MMESLPIPPAPLESDSPAADRRLAIIVGGLFFVLLLGWSSLVPLDSGVVASGTVTVAGNRQSVQHRDGGIVSGLYVRDGALVRQGQVLLSISANELEATERGLAAETYALLAQRQRLVAERDGLSEMTPPPEFAALTGANRILADEALAGQRRQFRARSGLIGAQQGVLSQRSRQNDEQITGLQRQREANREQRRLLEDELKGMREIQAKGFASINRIRALERSLAALDGDYGALSAQIARSGEAIGEVSMQSIAIDRGLVEQASDQLKDVNLRLDQNRPKLAVAKAQLARAQVRAPASGRVVGLAVFTVGGVVGPGQLLMEIVPQDRELIVSAMISPRDADDVTVGQTAQVRFTALQERSLPILRGTVTRLSADSLTDARTGESFFRAEIRVPATELAKAQAVRPGRTVIHAGLPADIFIALRKRSALAYLVEPLTQSLWRAGRED